MAQGTLMEAIGDAVALSILGVCLGHPSITEPAVGYPRNSMQLEELDNAFDDVAYNRDWLPWEWKPGLCINCLNTLKRDSVGACESCGWMQNGH